MRHLQQTSSEGKPFIWRVAIAIRDILAAALGSIIAAAVMGFFALPAYNADFTARLKALEGNLGRLEALVKDVTTDNSALQNRVYAVEQNIEAIKSTDPMTVKCAEIMREIRQPRGMGIMTRNEETRELVNPIALELMERFERLGCSQRVQ